MSNSLTSSEIIRLARLGCSSGGIRDPLRGEPETGANELFLESPPGLRSLITSILGASGALICGTLTYGQRNEC